MTVIDFRYSHYILHSLNKMMSHCSRLRPDVLYRLFKSYYCSFYDSFLWQYNSKGFEKMCTYNME